MDRKFLFFAIGLSFLVLIVFLAPRFLFKGKNLLSRSVPDNPASEACQKISQPEDIYSCLAVVNADSDFCQKIGSVEEKNVCLALTNKDLSFCRKIRDQEAKKICYYELSFVVREIDYCEELKNWEECYFSFIHRLYWREKSDEIEAKYCEEFSRDAGGDLAFRNSCWALKEGDSSLCQGNEHCLSFFKQPLSFCENTKSKGKSDCLRDRALTARDTSICEEIGDVNMRDNCYGSYSAHISPDLSLCEKINDKMTRNMCYREYAINLANE